MGEVEAGNHDAVTPTVSKEITTKLIRRITGEIYPFGSKLPTERELAQEFHVTRHVIREALKRLEAIGLVRIRHGSGIYVENLQLTAGIEVFNVLLMGEDDTVNLEFLRDVIEFRDQIIRLVVQLAARRRTDAERDEMKRLVHKRRLSIDNPSTLDEVSAALYRLIAQASHNQIFVLMFNTMERIIARLRWQFDVPVFGLEQTQEALEKIVDAIAQENAEKAAALAMTHVEKFYKTFFGKEPSPGPA